MALSADTVPHYTTIAGFVSSLSAGITTIFRNVLLVCDEAGLIGREMFAIDGVKLPGNASKEWSGTKADLKRKAQKMQRALEHIVARHRAGDVSQVDGSMQAAAERQKQTLSRAIGKIEGFMARHEDKLGSSGKPKQSNITDNESAKMKTNKGVIQGYNGVAIADEEHQVIVQAEAFGEGQEQQLLQPMLEQTRATFEALGGSADILKEIRLTADAGYSSEANAQYLAGQGIDGYVADTRLRQRDPRFESAGRHKPARPDEPFAKPQPERVLFRPGDFRAVDDMSHCICPAGQRLHRNGKNVVIDGRIGTKFKGSHRSCRHCALRAQCLRHPDRSPYRQVVFFRGFEPGRAEKHLDRMKRKRYGRLNERMRMKRGRRAA